MFKHYLLSLALLGGVAVAADAQPKDLMIKGDITKDQFMKMAEQRFARQDTNGDGVISVAEKEAAMAKMQEAMKKAGKTPSEKWANAKPKNDTTKAQFVERQEKLFKHLDANGDGVLSEAERMAQKEKMKHFKQEME